MLASRPKLHSGICIQLIHPKLANIVQKPPRTASHATKPPSGASSSFFSLGTSSAPGTGFSGSVSTLAELGVVAPGPEACGSATGVMIVNGFIENEMMLNACE